MTFPPDTAAEALLPNGLRDLLPPNATCLTNTTARLMAVFAAHGFERVEPPLIEFEESLFSGAGRVANAQTFRVMDPISRRMMGVRSDMTTQVARIAATRLATAPRPLRLAYGGPVLRVQGTQLRPERQSTQVGFELIGANGDGALSESLLVSLDALSQVGIEAVTIDLTCPPLVPALCAALGYDEGQTRQIRQALGQKDLRALDGLMDTRDLDVFRQLAKAVGPADRALAVLEAVRLPPEGEALRASLVDVARRVLAFASDHDVTLDPFEFRGFEYKTGVAFSLFAQGARGELGRGGAYVNAFGGGVEPACGATLYLECILEVACRNPRLPRLLVFAETSPARRRDLHARGFVTIAALDGVVDETEASRLGCDNWLSGTGEVMGASSPPSVEPTHSLSPL